MTYTDVEKPSDLVRSIEVATRIGRMGVQILDREQGVIHLFTGEAVGITVQIIGRGYVIPTTGEVSVPKGVFSD